MNKFMTSSNQRLGECVRWKVSQWQKSKIVSILCFSNRAKRGISSRNVLEERLRDKPDEHLSAK